MSGWRHRWWQTLRALWRQPRFTLVVTAAIGLGVAAVTTVFALIEATLLRQLPVVAGERLLAAHRPGDDSASISLPDARHWRSELKQVDAFAVVMLDRSLDWMGERGAIHLKAGLTESEFFRALAQPPMIGRLLSAADDQPGAAPVVVLAEPFWRQQFASDPAVLGQVIELSGVPAQIVGVASTGSDLWERGLQAWVPIPAFAPWAPTSAGSNNFEVVARRGPGVSLASARAELATVNQQLLAAGLIGEHKLLQLRPLLDQLTGDSRPGLLLALGCALLVLLLAGVNVAALLLVRLHGRRADFGVRHALGAALPQLRGELLREGAVLGLFGGILGLLLALSAFQGLRLLAAEALPRLDQGSPGWGTAIFAPAVAMLTVLLFSSLTARYAVRDLGDAARAQARTVERLPRRLLGSIVILEVTLAVMLLCGASLLLRSFMQLSAVPLGFEPRQALTAALALPESRYSTMPDQSRAVTGIVANLAAQPGVQHAGFILGLPLSGSGAGHSFVLEGASDPGASAGTRFRPFHGDYFAAAGLQLVQGRNPQPADLQPGERLAWINQSFAERHLAGRNPIGQRLAWTPGEAADASLGPQWMRIVGVVADTRTSSLREGDSPAVYAPYLQRDDNWIRFGQLVIRVQGEPAAFAQAMQDAVSAVDPGVALASVRPWSELVATALRPAQLQTLLAASCALIASLLGLFGIVAVIQFITVQRRRELGLRMVLGASPHGLLQMILQTGLKQLLVGISLGALAAWGLAQALGAWLFGVSAHDTTSYLLVTVATLLCGLLAIGCTARRLLVLQPQTAMRD